MSITKEAMILILSRIQVFSVFVNIISRFELRTKESYTSINCASPFYSRNEQIQDKFLSESNRSASEISTTKHLVVFESAYTLKHVELNNRSGNNQWSLRQMAVYQRFDTSTKILGCVLIQTSTQVQKRILELSKDGGLAELSNHWTILHEVYFGTLGQNWAMFLQSINIEVGSTVSHLHSYYMILAQNPRIYTTSPKRMETIWSAQHLRTSKVYTIGQTY